METRTETINIRVTKKQKRLIDQAVERTGKNRSDFMLETVCREAESVLLDQTHFSVSREKFLQFMAILDQPPKDNPKLRELLDTKPPWER